MMTSLFQSALAPWAAPPWATAARERTDPRPARAFGVTIERRVTESYTDQIVAMPDAAARNVLITQAYHDISVETASVLGTRSINWCTMAAWASRRAGQTIRGEDVRGQPVFSILLSRFPAGARLARELRAISAVIGAGNREVFMEVAPAFVAFLEAFGRGARADREDEGRLLAFMRRFEPGPAREGGQDELRRAFELYHHALSEPRPKRKAEQIHAANLLIALQEQTRLQGRIAASMPAGLAPLITKAVLSLEIGGSVTYRLGADLPARPFAAHLDTIEDPELRALILRFDPDIHTTRGSAADRWDVLDDRMRFIVDLFRLHGSDPALFEEPMSDVEWRALTGVPRPPR